MSPKESLKHAGIYLFHLKEKGYPILQGVDKSQATHIYDRNLLTNHKQRVKENLIKDAKNNLKKVDKKYSFYLNSPVLKRIEKEFRTLPWNIIEDYELTVMKLHDFVLSLARAMTINGKFDEKKLNRRQLQHSTDEFVQRVFKIRSDLLRYVIKNKLIKIEQLPKKPYFEEFHDLLMIDNAESNPSQQSKSETNKKDSFHPDKREEKYENSGFNPRLLPPPKPRYRTRKEIEREDKEKEKYTSYIQSTSMDQVDECFDQDSDLIYRMMESGGTNVELPPLYRAKLNFRMTEKDVHESVKSTKQTLQKLAKTLSTAMSQPSQKERSKTAISHQTVLPKIQHHSAHVIAETISPTGTCFSGQKRQTFLKHNSSDKLEQKNIQSQNNNSLSHFSHSRPNQELSPKVIEDPTSSVYETELSNPRSSDTQNHDCQVDKTNLEIVSENLETDMNCDEKGNLREPRQLQTSIYWSITDPLKLRQGEYVDQLKMIKRLGESIDPVIIPETSFSYRPFNLQSIPIVVNKTPQISITEHDKGSSPNLRMSSLDILKEISNIAQSTDFNVKQNIDEQPKKPIFSFKPEFEINRMRIAGYQSPAKDSSALRYLEEHDLDLDDDSSQVYHKIETIWDSLGFSISQKLEMALKYSASPENSSKLGDSLVAWENAFAAATSYIRAYKTIRDYIVFGGKNVDKKEITLESLQKDLSESEEGVQQIAQYLKTTFGDDLIIKRRRAIDLIKVKRKKIKFLKQEYGFIASSKKK